MLQLHRHGRSVFLAIREDKWWDSIYFHILMDNLPVIVSLYSVNDNVFLSDFNTLWLHNVNSLCSFTGKQRKNYMWSPRHICMHIHNNVWFFGGNTSVKENVCSLKWDSMPCHHQVAHHLESVNLCSSPLFPPPPPASPEQTGRPQSSSSF